MRAVFRELRFSYHQRVLFRKYKVIRSAALSLVRACTTRRPQCTDQRRARAAARAARGGPLRPLDPPRAARADGRRVRATWGGGLMGHYKVYGRYGKVYFRAVPCALSWSSCAQSGVAPEFIRAIASLGVNKLAQIAPKRVRLCCSLATPSRVGARDDGLRASGV
eukprot:scaffold28695_cov62-Phaeocystis_antarctica.AAC.5